MEWQPIETCKVEPFNKDKWFSCAARVIGWLGNWSDHIRYEYTQAGRGRWIDSRGRICNPTHWMPIPPAPTQGKTE